MLARARQISRLKPGHVLVALFLLTVLLPAALLAFLGFRAFRQERRLADQQVRDRLERAAELAARGLEEELREWQRVTEAIKPDRTRSIEDLAERVRIAVSEPGAAAVVLLGQPRPRLIPESQLLYDLAPVPARSLAAQLPDTLREAETQELLTKNYSRAIQLYSEALSTVQPSLRPTLLHRLARTYRKSGQPREALRLYQKLASMEDAHIGDLPASLLAAYEGGELQSAQGPASGALEFYGDLVNGRWRLDRPRYLFYSATASEWLTAAAASPDAVAQLRETEQRKQSLTRAVEEFLRRPRRLIATDAAVHVAFWQPDPFAALVLSGEFLNRRVWPRAFSTTSNGNLEVVLLDSKGGLLFGPAPAAAPQPFGVRVVQDADFIWRIRTQARDARLLYADLVNRQNLYLGMLLLLVMLLTFGTYLTARTVRKELEIARMKSEFVSTVSHEFRSPLAGIRQLGELLMLGRVRDDERRQEYYRLITKESDRLGRLIENLLDFSRMEEGRKEYRPEPLEPAGWLKRVAAEFESESAEKNVHVSLHVPSELPTVQVDREALGCAVHNLLDNAVKYSPGSDTVWLEAERANGGVSIRVRDCGVGIAEEEQKHVFEKFYRGSGEIRERVKGAGLGLSLVKHIVEAHGGTVECQSRPGEGSTFTIHLAARKEDDAAHTGRGR